MPARLVPCPSCKRHVKLGPPSCPFCHGPVAPDAPARRVLAGRPLSRAAIVFASAAASAAGVDACTASSSHDAGLVIDGEPMALYGAVVQDDAMHAGEAAAADGGTTEAGTPDANTLGGVDAAYGAFVDSSGG